MRLRVSWALAAVALGLAVADAQDAKVPDDFRCDVRSLMSGDSKRSAKVGDAITEVEDETESRGMRELDDAGEETTSKDEKTKLHKETVWLLTARDEEAKTSEAQVRFVAWRSKKNDEPEDTSLEGKVVVVRTADKKRSFSVANADGSRAKVSDEALAWLRKEYGPKKVTQDDEKKLARIAPEKPVAPDAEWTGDPKIVCDVLFDGAPIDADHSKITGKITKVRADGKSIAGTLVLDMKIKLLNVPATTVKWDEGGVLEGKLEQDGLLDDPTSPRADSHQTFHMQGKVRLAAGQAASFREVDYKAEKTTMTRAAKAPEKLQLKFDPEADYRWDVQQWASGDDETAPVPQVGDRSFMELDVSNMSHVVVNGKTTDKKTVLSARVEFEVTAVADKKETERKGLVKRWKFTQDDELDDSLEGKTIVLIRAPKGGEKPWKVVDARGNKCTVNATARAFIEGDLGRLKTHGLQLDNLQEVLGNAPLIPEEDMAVDPAKTLTKLFGEGQEIDPKKSTGTAKLDGVHVVSGDHEGKLEAHVVLKLKTIPGAPGGHFDDPATCDLVFSFEGSLDRSRTGTGTSTVTMDYSGKGIIEGRAGKVTFEPHVVTKRVIRTGLLPKKSAD